MIKCIFLSLYNLGTETNIEFDVWGLFLLYLFLKQIIIHSFKYEMKQNETYFKFK